MRIMMTAVGHDTLLAKARRAVRMVDPGTKRVVEEYGDILLQTTIQNASGRPGPNIITGQYVGAMAMVRTGRYEVGVTNPSPQTNRLEFGFVGVDAIGRHYMQPAFPHFLPALAEVGPMFSAAMRAEVKEWWGA